MENSRVTLIILLCVVFFSQKRTYGAKVKIRARPGENVTIYCDCKNSVGSRTVWFRNCSHENQPPLIIDTLKVYTTLDQYRNHFDFVENSTNRSFNLLIKNVTINDVGLYYCASMEKKIKDEKKIVSESIYHYGNQTTHLSIRESPNTTQTPQMSQCQKLLVGVCTVCALLPSIVSSICVYCICAKRNKANVDEAASVKRQSRRIAEAGEDDICYASLDTQKLKKKTTKRKVQNSDFTTYSEVMRDRV